MLLGALKHTSVHLSLRVYLVNMYPKPLYFSFCDVFFTVTFFRLSWYPKKSSGLLRYKKPEILLVLLVNSFLRVIGKPVVKNRNSVINRPYWMQRSIESEYANYDSQRNIVRQNYQFTCSALTLEWDKLWGSI